MCPFLRECVETLATRFRQGPITVSGWDVSTGEATPCRAPRYLFRGESHYFPSTLSSIDRVRAGSDSHIADEIEKIVEWVKASTAHELELEEVGAHALLQHYSLPTELVDFTSNLDVAATFANDGRRDGEGCIGVLDLNIAIRQLTIFNLTVLQLAERAIRQDAFGVPLPCLAAMAKIAACLSLPNSSTVMHPHSRTCGNTKSYCKEDWHGMAIA